MREQPIRRYRGNALTSLLVKAALLTAVAACGIIGVAGLVLPIVPGILFLGAAAVLWQQLDHV